MLMLRQKPFEAVQVKKGSEDEVLEFVKRHILISAAYESKGVVINTAFDKVAISYGDYLAYTDNRFISINKDEVEKYYEAVN